MKSKVLLGPLAVLVVTLLVGFSVPLPLARGASPEPQGPTLTLYTVEANTNLLRTVDPATGATLSSVPITLSGFTVSTATGLATHPSTGELWALVGLTGQTGGRRLVRVTATTGVATLVGNTGDAFAGIAFDCSGNLFGITGDGANEPESLFSINTTTGAATLLSRLRRGDDGEALAFFPTDGMLYHASGHVGDLEPDGIDGVMFEKLDPLRPPFVNIPIAVPLTDAEIQALTWSSSAAAFLWKQGNSATGPLFRVTAAGAATLVGTMDHQAKGLAISGGTLFSVSSRDNLLRVVNAATAATVSSVAMTLTGQTITRGHGLAAHPSTGQLFAIVALSGVSNRSLVTLNSTTGVATLIGNTGDFVNSLAFDAAGTLYGTTGYDGTLQGSLVSINTTTGAITYVYTLDREESGLALAFNSTDGRFYFGTGDAVGSMFFEKFNIADLPINISIAGTLLVDEEAQSLTAIPGQTNFLWKQNHGTGPLFRVTSTGTPTLLGNMDHQAKGLAFTGGTCAVSADLSVAKTDSPDPLLVGANLTYNITVTNAGPATANNVTLTDPLPAGVTFVSVTQSQGTCSQAAGTVTCPLGAIANAGTATVAIVVTPTAAGTLNNTATVTSGTTDPVSTNNSATTSTVVNSPVPPGITLSASPTSMVVPAGLAARFRLTVGAVGGLSGNVALACSGLPPKAECVFTPAPPVTVSEGSPATVDLVVNTVVGSNVVASSAPALPMNLPAGPLAWAIALSLLALACFVMLRGRKRVRAGAVLAIVCLAALLWTGCGGADGTTQGVYNVTVTATSGSATQSIDLGLTVR